MRQPLSSLSGISGIALLTGLLLPAALTWRSIPATVAYRQQAQKTPYEYGFPIAAVKFCTVGSPRARTESSALI
jgi:hypothetical protein